jgi:methyl-accepting chemotaxis protein
VQRVVAQLEDGDLTQRLPEESRDEIGEIARAVNGFVGKAHTIFNQLHASADELASAAARLFSASEDIAGSSRGQSNAASSVASTVEELTVSIAQVSELAQDAHSISRDSGDTLANGSDVVLSAAEEMNRISHSVRESSDLIMDLEQRSADISAIIKVIRDVAEQTNLLALNAAIEAARAGEQGRGFAVVADEVRSLAERTSESTEEIANVISKIQEATRVAAGSMEAGVERVERGVALASEAGESITSVRSSAGRVVDVVDSISLALREQTAASEDISRQVENIAAISQENSEAAQRTVSTARELERLAVNLEQGIKQFRL